MHWLPQAATAAVLVFLWSSPESNRPGQGHRADPSPGDRWTSAERGLPAVVTGFTLIDAQSDQPIAAFDPIPDGAVILLSDLPSQDLNIRADTDPAVVGSVRFDLDGRIFSTENVPPYALAGDQDGNYASWAYTPGVVGLTATPFAESNAQGQAGTPLSITFELVAGCGTDDDCSDGAFCNGAEVCIGGLCGDGDDPCPEPQVCDEQEDVCLPAPECAADADCDDGVFCNGPETCVAGACAAGSDPCADSTLPSNFNGDDRVDGLDLAFVLAAWGPNPGDPADLNLDGVVNIADLSQFLGTWGLICIESLEVCINCITAADCNDGLFCTGSASCVDFDCLPGTPPCVDGQPCDEANDVCLAPGQTVLSFSLIDADLDQPVPAYDPLVDGAVINLADLPTVNLNVRANTDPPTVGSVQFALDGNANFQTENQPPYALAGDSGGDYNAWTPALGERQLTATPFTDANAGGAPGTPLSITFEVTNDAGPPNEIPVADAGPDVEVGFPVGEVVIQGSGSDSDGMITAYLWTHIGGPPVALSGQQTPTLTVIDPPEAVYIFRLQVTDDLGAVGSDTMQLTVGQPPDVGVITGELKKWHRVTITFDGPQTSEAADPNPFVDYRLNVVFSNGGASYTVPGFYAADGDAAESSAASGNKWRVHFAPDQEGLWTYVASFRTGPQIAASLDPLAGDPAGFDGASGSFEVGPTDKVVPDLRAKGLLGYVGEHYLQFAETGEYYLKGGADSPENMLGYFEFDNTFDNGGLSTPGLIDGLHHFAPHVVDWQPGDPTWQGAKGQGIIGALNYLAGQGINSVYFLTFNVAGGDGQDTWVWTSPEERLRFDCSKLDQWEIVFAHMDGVGLQLHVVTQETENDQNLDGGALGLERKLYYRELVARFGHHLAVIWNLGEENTNSNAQRLAFAEHLRALDVYRHPVTVHTQFNAGPGFYNALYGDPNFEATSLQGSGTNYNGWAIDIRQMSAAAGRKWAVYGDEQGPAVDDNLDNLDTLRKNPLWGNLMGGGAGVEWYFGYQGTFGDVQSEDWSVVEPLWQQTVVALQFFQQHLPFAEMEPRNDLTSSGLCFAKPGDVYALYLSNGGTADLDLQDAVGPFTVHWYDPAGGGPLQTGSVSAVTGPGVASVGDAPHSPTADWAVLIQAE